MDNHDQNNFLQWQAFSTELRQKEADLQRNKAAGMLHPDEEIYLEEIQSVLMDPELKNVFHMADPQEGWQAIRKQIQPPAKIVRFTPALRYFAYAASIVLVMGLGWFSLKQLNKSTDKQEFAQSTIDKHKATLILADGSKVVLDKKTNLQLADENVMLSDSARAISYKAGGDLAGVYHTLITPRGGEYKLVMSDGTEIWLNSETRLRYPAVLSAAGERDVYLEKGEAYFKVAKNKHAPFKVNLNGMQVEVLGTSFNINAFNKKISTTLVEGSIRVNRKGKEAVMQVPGEQTNFDPLTQAVTKSVVDVYPFTSWKDGWLVFNDNSLEDVLDQVGRWYDYQIVFESPELKSLRFGGKLRKSKDIKAILSVIERSNELRYTITNQTIHIYPKE